MNWLRGRTVLITGATGGLGQPLCHAFTTAGAKVMGADLAAVVEAQNLISLPPQTTLYSLDVTVPGSWRQLHGQTGDVDVLVHNAGITALDCFRTGGSAMVKRVMAVNFNGTVAGTEVYLPGLRRRAGRIVVLSSVAGFAPLYGRTAYAASKHALHGFYESLQAEERSSGLRITLVSPAFIATGIRAQVETAGAGGKLRQNHELSPDFVARRIVRAVAGGQRRLRLGKTAHFAWWLHFLLPGIYEKAMVRATAGSNSWEKGSEMRKNA